MVLLTGPKHSGKTVTGRALALALGGEFADLDEVIERQTGKSPRTLYKEGAEVFRKAEARALASLVAAHPADGGGRRVVAAGGGLCDNAEAMALLEKAEGVTAVYLEVPAETAWRRIDREAKKTGEMPPFLNTPSPEKTHRELHERRAAAYRQKAHIIISAENKTPELIAQEIMKEANLPSRG